MFHRFHEHFGPAGLVVAVVALIAALSGGAIAATGGNPFASSSQASKSSFQGLTKKQVLALIKANAVPGAQGEQGFPGANGKDGAPGKDGVDGVDGEKGENGEDGVDGANGTTGKSVLSGSGPPSNAVGTNGDFYIDTSASELYGPKASNIWPASGISMKGANGDDGSPWTAGGTLPVGSTETGAWGFHTTVSSGFQELESSISFFIPLASGLNEEHVHVALSPSADCPGTVANPQAASGHLCLYIGHATGEFGVTWEGFITKLTGSGFDIGANTAGARLFAFAEKNQNITGTWAVTG